MRHLLFLLLMTATMLCSCGKEEMNNETTPAAAEKSITFKSSDVETLAKGVRVIDGTLSFESMEQFTQVVEGLTELTDKHDDAFVDANEKLTIDELEALEVRIGHNEVQPLIDFEKILKFESRRAKVEVLTEKWLDNKELDFKNNPETTIDGNSPVVRTLLNEKGIVKIEGKDVDLNILKAAGRDCWEYAYDFDSGVYDNGNRGWNMAAAAGSTSYTANITCSVCNYKKVRGEWKKRRKKVYVYAGAKVRKKSNCREKDEIHRDKERKRRCLTVTATNYGVLGGNFYRPRYEDHEALGSMIITNTNVGNQIFLED